MRLRLFENHRFVLYAPFYAAHTTCAYTAEGLNVDLSPSPVMGLAEQALIDGAVDVIWAGPMRVMKHHDANPGSPLVCFAEIVCRDPFSIVGCRPNPNFCPADLSAMKFATVSEVPTPWLCLQEDLRQAGVDPARLDRVSDRTMADNLEALRQGRLDAAQLFEPRSNRPWLQKSVTSGILLVHAAAPPTRPSSRRGTGSAIAPRRYCAWCELSSGRSNGFMLALFRRSWRPLSRFSQRSITTRWPDPLPGTDHS
jgi:NMT1/THI5 like